MKEKNKRKDEKKRVICIENAPKAIGPYSQGIALKKLVFFSGQLGIIPETGKLADGGIIQQAKQIFVNIDALLKSEGLTSADVIKTTVFITDMSKFADVNAEYAAYFSVDPPARSCVEVSKLPLGALVEIEVTAFRSKK